LAEQDDVDVAVGGEHALALTKSGTVWSWGGNSEGQLGLGHTTGIWEPQLVHSLSNKSIKQVRVRNRAEHHSLSFFAATQWPN